MNQYLSRADRGAVLASTLALPFAATAPDDGATGTIHTVDVPIVCPTRPASQHAVRPVCVPASLGPLIWP